VGKHLGLATTTMVTAAARTGPAAIAVAAKTKAAIPFGPVAISAVAKTIAAAMMAAPAWAQGGGAV
jgi:hypothetical protein